MRGSATRSVLRTTVSQAWRLSAALLLLSTRAFPAQYGSGIVNAEVSGRAAAVAIDSSGRIVTAGSDYNLGPNGYALTRHYSDGAPDDSFGNNGLLVSDFSPQGMGAYASAVAIDKTGRILIAGSFYSLGVPVRTFSRATRFFLARYNSDGTFDAGFGAGGFVTTDLSGAGDWATSLVIDDQGRIVVGGSAAGGSGSIPALVRYNADGSLDSTFAAGGIGTAPNCGTGGRIAALTLDGLGRIVAAGSCNGSFMLARFNPGGALDSTFGANGTGIATVSDTGGGGVAQWAAAVAVDGLGRIIAGGEASTLSPVAGTFYSSFALVRSNSDGTLDSTFGAGGIVTNHISGEGIARDDAIFGLSLDHLGRIVAVGGCPTDCGSFDFELARYNPDGSLDRAFGIGGIVVTHLGNVSSNNASQAVAIDSAGRILAAGSSDDDTVLVRYNPDGVLDRTFGGGRPPFPPRNPRPLPVHSRPF